MLRRNRVVLFMRYNFFSYIASLEFALTTVRLGLAWRIPSFMKSEVSFFTIDILAPIEENSLG